MKHCFFLGWLLLTWVISFSAQAATLEQNIEQANAIQADARESQQKVDRLAGETEALLDEYKRLVSDSDYQKQYLADLKNLHSKQLEIIASLNNQVDSVQYTQQKMGPLLKVMLDSLEQFVLLDLPFHHQERINGLLGLRHQIDDVSLPVSQKYRLLMEAFQIELAYGENLESYRGRVVVDSKDLSVEFLRIGRLTLYYQTFDGENSAVWDKQTRNWKPLPQSYNYPILSGIRVAKSQVAPQLLTLPTPTLAEVKP